MSSRLFIESIGSEEFLIAKANSEDAAFVERFSNERRRCEVLAWRAIVRRELGNDVKIGYDEYGAPMVDVPNSFISVSHSKGVVAVMIAEAPCAVDIEQSERDFAKVASKYLSEDERQLAEQNNLFAELWCAKEALYKYYKIGGVDLAADLTVSEYLATEGVLVASILGGEPLRVQIKREGDLAIALVE